MTAEVQAEEVYSNLVAEKKTMTKAPIQSNQKAHRSLPNKKKRNLKTVSLIAGPNHLFKIGETTMIDPRGNTLHQIDIEMIDNKTTSREKAIVVDIEIMIGGTKEKTDLRGGSTINMRTGGLKDRNIIIVTEMEGTIGILETTIEEMIHESRVMHQGLIYTNPTGKFKEVCLTKYKF